MDEEQNNLESQQEPMTPEDVVSVVKDYLQTAAFTDRKLTDYPTDDYMVVNRKYVTANGVFASRPAGAVIGQPYFATDLATNGLASWYNGTNWVSGTGSILGVGL